MKKKKRETTKVMMTLNTVIHNKAVNEAESQGLKLSAYLTNLINKDLKEGK